MIFYRLESAKLAGILAGGGNGSPIKHNMGAYCSESGIKRYALDGACESAYDDWVRSHPDVAIDMGLYKQIGWSDYSRYIFGFHTLQQLKQWFSCIDEIVEADSTVLDIARIGVYQVPDEHYIKGTFQVMAVASKIELVRVITLDSDEVASIVI